MTLLILLLVLFLTGALSLMSGPKNAVRAKIILGLGFGLALLICGVIAAETQTLAPGWFIGWSVEWIGAWGINVHLGIDSFAWWLIVLSLVMGFITLSLSWPTSGANTYGAGIAWAVFGSVSLFMAVDTFLFFVFWELSLVPLYWLLWVHGDAQRKASTIRYFIYTQASGALLLMAILGLAISHQQITGTWSFDYFDLVTSPYELSTELTLLVLFLLAFAIKLPLFPFHGWLPGVFAQAPLAFIMVGVLVKTAVFGLGRFTWAMFPAASDSLSIPMMLLGVFSLIYGAVVAFGQRDPKKLLAFGTLSHVGMLVLGIFANSQTSFQGMLLLVITQALSTGGLVMIVGSISSQQDYRGGISWQQYPRVAVMFLIFTLAGFGFPLFGNFIGEFLVFMGTFQFDPLIGGVACIGMVFGALYSLRLFQKLCWEAPSANFHTPSLHISRPQSVVCALMVVALIVLGLHPDWVIASATLPYETMSANDAPPEDN